MIIKELETYNFRNLQNSKICLSPFLNVFVGQNGQGKTNILEAVNLLATLKSFRTANTSELIKWNHSSARIASLIEDPLGEINVAVALWGRERIPFIEQNQVRSMQDFLGKLSTVLFQPSDLEIVKGGPSERRSFLDKHVIDLEPQLIKTYLAYQKALKNKQVLLKDGASSKTEIEAWNHILAREGALIISARERLLTRLAPLASTSYRSFSSDSLEVTFIPSWKDYDDSALFGELMNVIEREMYLKQCIAGPHRHDFEITIGDVSARTYASQGQTRSILLALKLAMISLIESLRGSSPVILLDDVASELDRHRSESFFELLFSEKRQVLVTTTDQFPPIGEAVKFQISKGEVHQR